VAAGVAGCGGGDKAASSTVGRVNSAPTASQTTPQAGPAPSPTQPTQPSKPPPTTTSPQAAPGGSEPARTELTFTATKGGISPGQAGVAPFISVRITLVSSDGTAHTLTIGGHTLSVGPGQKSAPVTLPGLKPGRSYTGRADGGRTVRILSTSEPGP
jgi:hypothetical protein